MFSKKVNGINVGFFRVNLSFLLKEIFFEIIGEINLELLTSKDTDYKFPIIITIDDLKYKYLKDYDSYNQQKNVNNYFKEINNYDFMFEGNIDKKNVENLEECLDYCHNEGNCKNVLYMKEKDRCEFYGSKDILNILAKWFMPVSLFRLVEEALCNVFALTL